MGALRPRLTRCVALLLTLLGLTPLARAQVGPDAPQLAARLDLQRQLRARLQVSWDPETGCPGRVTFQPPLRLRDEDPAGDVRGLLRRLEGLYGRLTLAEDRATRRGPWLVAETPLAFGDDLRVLRFRQELEGCPLDGARLRVTVRRGPAGWQVESVSGRLWRDCPPLEPPGPGPWLVTPRPDGQWRFAKEQLDTSSGYPVRVLVDEQGQELVREAAWQSGTAQGEIPGVGKRPLVDLELVDDAGRVLTTDGQGAFPGDVASLPGGLSGVFERVLARDTTAYPSTRDGRLRVPANTSARAAELALYHHLVRFRRDVLGRIPGLPASTRDSAVLGLALEGDLNAYASPEGATVAGRRYERLVVIGSAFKSDGGVIAHERAHVLLYDLGFVPPRGNQGATSVHEGLADYFGAVYQGSPRIASGEMGVLARDIDEERHFPEHVYPLDPHESGRILAGALWDARRTLGESGGLALDQAVTRAVASFPAATDLPRAARAIREACGEAARATLERELREHGLLDTGEVTPRVTLQTRGQPAFRLSLQAGQTVELLAQAWAPGIAPEQLELLASRLSFRTLGAPREEAVAGEPRPALALPITLTPDDDDVGMHELVLTATDRVSERSAVLRIPVTVAPSDAEGSEFDYTQPDETALDEPVGEERVDVRVGERVRLPLSRFQAALNLEEQRIGRVGLAGAVPACATLQRRRLVIAPEAGEEGTHVFFLQAFPRGAERSIEQRRTCRVRLRVLPAQGSASGEVEVYEAHPTQVKPGGEVDEDPTLERVAPGRTLTMTAGQRLELLARGLPYDETGGGALRLVEQPTPIAVKVTVAGEKPIGFQVHDEREKLQIVGPTALALTLNAPADAAPQTVVLRVAWERDGAELARREVRIVIVPGTPTPAVEDVLEAGPGGAAPPAPGDEAAGPASGTSSSLGLTETLRRARGR